MQTTRYLAFVFSCSTSIALLGCIPNEPKSLPVENGTTVRNGHEDAVEEIPIVSAEAWSDSHRPPTSLIQILARREQYHGKKVRVQGFLVVEREGNAIYVSEDDAQYLMTGSRSLRNELDRVVRAPTEESFWRLMYDFLNEHFGIVPLIHKGGDYPIGQGVILKADPERNGWRLIAPSGTSELLPNEAFVRLVSPKQSRPESAPEENSAQPLVIVGSKTKIFVIDNTKDQLMVLSRTGSSKQGSGADRR